MARSTLINAVLLAASVLSVSAQHPANPGTYCLPSSITTHVGHNACFKKNCDLLEVAINQFQDDVLYGGSSEPVVSNVSKDGVQAGIKYGCNEKNVSPVLTGAQIKALANCILDCETICGGETVNENCNVVSLVTLISSSSPPDSTPKGNGKQA
ncbi:hypothetical protein BGZ63DRAFT_459099 [Mariannaea sp. PMI_226]|nr:hypothetical protein BGZ63DRAFT_459099 [Mariannaea sp. PMI_226]